MPILNPKCDKCESEMILKQKGADKFWGCPNWQRCAGKTKPFAGVEKPSEAAGSTVEETLARIEIKIDFLMDNIKPSKPLQSLGMKEIKSSGDFQHIKDIMVPDDDIDPKDIPF